MSLSLPRRCGSPRRSSTSLASPTWPPSVMASPPSSLRRTLSTSTLPRLVAEHISGVVMLADILTKATSRGVFVASLSICSSSSTHLHEAASPALLSTCSSGSTPSHAARQVHFVPRARTRARRGCSRALSHPLTPSAQHTHSVHSAHWPSRLFITHASRLHASLAGLTPLRSLLQDEA